MPTALTRLGSLFGICLVLLLTASALAQPAPSDWPEQPTPHIGVLLPLSGDYAHFGERYLEAIQLAFSDIPGVTWSVVDSEGDPSTAARRVRELADNPSTIAILGPVGLAESRAAAAAAQERRIPLIALSTQEGIEDAGRYAFRARVSVGEQARFMARIGVAELGLTRFAILHPDDHFGEEATEAFAAEVLRLGAQITGVESYETEEADYGEAIELLVGRRERRLEGEAFESPPDTRARHRTMASTIDFEALFIPEYHEQVGVILPFLEFYDIDPGGRVQLLGLSSWAGTGLSLSGELAHGALLCTTFHETFYSGAVRDLFFAFEEAYERTPSESEAEAYDTTIALVSIVRELSFPHRENLVQALLGGTGAEGLSGWVSFDELGRPLRELVVMSADDGGYVAPHYFYR